MDIKPQPNHKQYIESLRAMTEEQRLLKAFEMTKIAQNKLGAELRQKFPKLPDADFQQLFTEHWRSQE